MAGKYCLLHPRSPKEAVAELGNCAKSGFQHFNHSLESNRKNCKCKELSSRDDDCKCSCWHPSSVLCAAWQGHLAQVFLRVVGGPQHGGLPLDRHQAGIRENFSVPLDPQVQCCELLWVTFAQERGCSSWIWTLKSFQWTHSYFLSVLLPAWMFVSCCQQSLAESGECLVLGKSALRNWEGLLPYRIIFRCWPANWPSTS